MKQLRKQLAHMLLSCRHEDIKEYYTVRHDAAGRKLMSGLRHGTMGRWLIRANFGRVDGNPEDTTVPEWLLGTEGRTRIQNREEGDRGIKPDILILEGWPENARPPTKPERWWQGTPGAQRRRVTVHIAEMGFSSDFAHRRKYENKQLHYQPLMEELRGAGWNVHGRIHVITVGVRATVPNRNDEVLKEMGVSDRKDRERLQRDLVWASAKHAATIIAQFRKIQRKKKPDPRAGVG
jgi:hypothetical protein